MSKEQGARRRVKTRQDKTEAGTQRPKLKTKQNKNSRPTLEEVSNITCGARPMS